MDPHRLLPLANLANLHQKMESLQQFISASIRSNTLLGKEDMEMVSTEISSAIHQVIINGAALITTTTTTTTIQQFQNNPCSQSGDGVAQVADLGVVHPPPICSSFKGKSSSDLQGLLRDSKEDDEDCELVELDEVELLAEHVHFCEICGKGFKRDANLRMHMRAHGNRFKTLEALAKPDRFITGSSSSRNHKPTRFSCPFVGCNRNKGHGKFRPLKSAICVKNHFKRTHCPKMFSCNRCNKKSFSVVGDLKNHLKHCGEAESKWRCSCGNSFSRKDKLFGHLALFEGHMPAINVADEGELRSKATTTAMEEEEGDDDDEEEETHLVNEGESAVNGTEGVVDQLFWDDLQQGGFGGFGDEDCLNNVFDSPTEMARTVDGWFQI